MIPFNGPICYSASLSLRLCATTVEIIDKLRAQPATQLRLMLHCMHGFEHLFREVDPAAAIFIQRRNRFLARINWGQTLSI
ncbi:hypothetical protein D3C87_917740 [compost metagenome]|jgi:hypothetical protein